MDRPILFSGPMVRALLAGTKTQTRRVLGEQPPAWMTGREPWNVYRETWAFAMPAVGGSRAVVTDDCFMCPYGAPEDTLWVREGFAPRYFDDGSSAYRADWTARAGDVVPEPKWKPSIHMPRLASRITLRVTNVRVQRVQDITEEDAKAEGLSALTKDGGRLWKYGIPDRDKLPGNDDDGWHWREWDADPRVAFHKLWDSINAARGFGWDVNPFVWALTFERVTP